MYMRERERMSLEANNTNNETKCKGMESHAFNKSLKKK